MARFQFETYEPRHTGSIAEIMGLPARARAQALRQSGEAQARAAEFHGQNAMQLGRSLGDIARGTIGDLVQYQQDAPRREMDALRLDAARREADAVKQQEARDAAIRTVFPRVLSGEVPPDALLEAAGPKDGLAILQGLESYQQLTEKRVTNARDTAGRLAVGLKSLPADVRAQLWPDVRRAAIAGGLGDEQTIPAEPTDQFLDGIVAWATGQPPKGPGTRQVEVTNLDGSKTIQIVPDTPGQSFTSAPDVKKHAVTVRGPNGAPLRKLFTEEELARGVEEYRPPDSTSKARFWVMREGKPVRISEEEYRVGDAPANTREQGRPVTSGDAGRIADYQTALDDLNVLTRDLGLTGTGSKVGAMLPNWVTDMTGWGADSKSRQAVIDRVKQVIGKALEGGVLRKEDEVKYEKILPTIADENSVAKTKIKGLWEAIEKRLGTTIDALADAGYDVTEFRARAPRQRTDDAAEFSVKAPDGQTYTFATKAQLEAFKLRAGIK